jgi:hypothetical protein
MGLPEAPLSSAVAAAATLLRVLGPRRVAAAAASSRSGAEAPVRGSVVIGGAGEPPNPLMQPERRFSQGRLQLISISLGGRTEHPLSPAVVPDGIR